MGRPVKYTDEFIKQITDAVNEYTDRTDIPILAEFAYQNKVPRQKLYMFAEKSDEFSYSIKRLLEKKEAQLERQCLNGKIDKTMAVFSLKQLGWKDKNETEHTGSVGIQIVDNIPRNKNANSKS